MGSSRSEHLVGFVEVIRSISPSACTSNPLRILGFSVQLSAEWVGRRGVLTKDVEAMVLSRGVSGKVVSPRMVSINLARVRGNEDSTRWGRIQMKQTMKRH